MTGLHARCRAAISKHFEGRISSRSERSMRAHLADCAECCAHYERYLVLSELDPEIPSEKDRIAIGLGLRAERAASFWPLAALGAGALAVALLAVGPGGLGTLTRSDEFQERGTLQKRSGSELVAYRMADGQASEQVVSSVRPHDELAFAYTNEAGWDYLAVFGLDEHGHVYWYYPAWSDPKDNPSSIRIQPGSELRELPDAVSHRLDGSSLRLFGIFSKTPVSVRQVEERLDSLKAGGEKLALPGTFEWQKVVEVGGTVE